ncbi:MAG TPA: hydrogenase iron-sulfur subunit, partial [Thermodesulfobacteriota bacterium]|nr:hydrogenase iron-sulfur subunit [Thermodesulfobacteriota bacterium]
GIDGVLIAGCREGQCHFINGNRMAKSRSDDLAEKLRKMVIEPERVRFENLEIRDSGKYISIVQSYISELRRIGPNPFRT